MATFLIKDKVVAVQVKRDGIYSITSEDEITQDAEIWCPYVEFNPFKPSAY